MESSGKGMKDLEASFGITMAAARKTADPPRNVPAGETAKSAKRGSSLKKKEIRPGKPDETRSCGSCRRVQGRGLACLPQTAHVVYPFVLLTLSCFRRSP